MKAAKDKSTELSKEFNRMLIYLNLSTQLLTFVLGHLRNLLPLVYNVYGIIARLICLMVNLHDRWHVMSMITLAVGSSLRISPSV